MSESTSTARQNGLSTTASPDGSDAAFITASAAYYAALDAATTDEERAAAQDLWWKGTYGRRGLMPVRAES